jgi:hypothetical protein
MWHYLMAKFHDLSVVSVCRVCYASWPAQNPCSTAYCVKHWSRTPDVLPDVGYGRRLGEENGSNDLPNNVVFAGKLMYVCLTYFYRLVQPEVESRMTCCSLQPCLSWQVRVLFLDSAKHTTQDNNPGHTIVPCVCLIREMMFFSLTRGTHKNRLLVRRDERVSCERNS